MEVAEVNENLINNLAYKKLHFKNPEVIEVFGQFGMVDRELLKDLSISHGAKFFYSVLRAFIRFDKSRPHSGKTVMSERFLSKTWVCGTNKVVASRDRCVKWRKELEKAGLIKSEYSDEGWIISFLKEVGIEGYENITKKLVLSDKFNLKEKIFVINILPHILTNDNSIKFSNRKLSEITGYDQGTIAKYMESFEKKGLLYVTPEKRYFHLGHIMAGFMDNYIEATQKLCNVEKFLISKGYTEEQIERIMTGDF